MRRLGELLLVKFCSWVRDYRETAFSLDSAKMKCILLTVYLILLVAAALRLRTGFKILMPLLGCSEGWSQKDVLSTLAM